MARPSKNYNWDAVDWSDSSQDIADQLGCSLRSVGYQRKQRAPEQTRQYRQHYWEVINWLEPNWKIAATLKVSKTHVSSARRKFAPHTVRIAKRRK